MEKRRSRRKPGDGKRKEMEKGRRREGDGEKKEMEKRRIWRKK